MFGRKVEPTTSDVLATLRETPTPEHRTAMLTARPALVLVPVTASLTPVRTATASALRHRALCDCYECWAN